MYFLQIREGVVELIGILSGKCPNLCPVHMLRRTSNSSRIHPSSFERNAIFISMRRGDERHLDKHRGECRSPFARQSDRYFASVCRRLSGGQLHGALTRRSPTPHQSIFGDGYSIFAVRLSCASLNIDRSLPPAHISWQRKIQSRISKLM